MTREELYSIWAPEGAVWKPWAKAVVFANMPAGDFPITAPEAIDLSWLKLSPRAAIVIDLPGSLGVGTAIELARLSWRPVPLYNALPGGLEETVAVSSIAQALKNRAGDLAAIKLPFNAPPAFMLDSRRRGQGVVGSPGQFDNRSICFPTDFPSAAFLAAQGIDSVLLLKMADLDAEADLAHTLLRWQQAGIAILATALADEQPPTAITIARPSRFRSLWYGLSAALGLRHARLGGFGGMVPFPGQGGGFAG